MRNKILFSTLGFTDPTRDNYDGAYLHILRYLEPSKVYLFMTKEICEFAKKDNRYIEMGKRIVKKANLDCEFYECKHSEIDKPHIFNDTLSQIFEDEIEKIIEQNPDCELLINLSSGTPQMKETLHLICATSKHKLIPIQVESPAKQANRSKSTADTYNIDYEWNNLLDNDEDFKTNRINRVELKNILEMFTKEKIKEFVKNYNYEAAKTLAFEIKEHISNRTLKLLEGAVKRTSLKNDAFNSFRDVNYTSTVIKYSAASQSFEYILELDLKVKKKQYMDFIRAISPILAELYLEYLNVICKVDVIKKYYKLHGHGVYKLNVLEKKDELVEIFKRTNINEEFLAASNLLVFIKYFEKDDAEVLKIAEDLRMIEEKIRNKLAHEMIGIDDKDIKAETGYNSVDILKMIKRLFTKIYKNYITSELWNSYDDLNEEIIKSM